MAVGTAGLWPTVPRCVGNQPLAYPFRVGYDTNSAYEQPKSLHNIYDKPHEHLIL